MNRAFDYADQTDPVSAEPYKLEIYFTRYQPAAIRRKGALTVFGEKSLQTERCPVLYANGYKAKRIDTPAVTVSMQMPTTSGHDGEPFAGGGAVRQPAPAGSAPRECPCGG